MTDESQPELFPEPEKKKRPRAPSGFNLHQFLEGFGIDVQPYTEARGWKDRPPNVIYGGRTIVRLMRKDLERTATVVRCIQVSNPTCFDDVVIWAVWKILEAHFDNKNPAKAVEKFREIDIYDIKTRAQKIACGPYGRGTKSWTAIYSIIALEITQKGTG